MNEFQLSTKILEGTLYVVLIIHHSVVAEVSKFFLKI